jgi:arsenite methyltransferase
MTDHDHAHDPGDAHDQAHGPTPARSDAGQVREIVRDRYAAAARQTTRNLQMAASANVAPAATSCCGPARTATTTMTADPITRDLYDDEAGRAFEGAFAASLGCGNPTALIDLEPGQNVLDLGSGGGLDVLLSARRIAPTGTAYGLDMTTEMLELARRNQVEAGVRNAEFLQGTIEDVPLPDGAVDVVISNCVINLAADKDPVLREAFRVLAPGGRFAVSDIVVLRPLPAPAQRVVQLWTGCIAGALRDTEYVATLTAAGFVDATVEITRTFTRQDVLDVVSELRPEDLPAGVGLDTVVDALDGAIASAFIRAAKP